MEMIWDRFGKARVDLCAAKAAHEVSTMVLAVSWRRPPAGVERPGSYSLAGWVALRVPAVFPPDRSSE